ncbi:MAG: hypothetical protein KDK28_05500, partial [Maritimibacter sp.]|nr:hypothetical protein [Maritimibacter sp.]
GFDRFVRVGTERVDFTLGPGQQTGGVPWTPYLTTDRDGWLRMDAEFLQPSMWDGVPAEIVHAYTAPDAMNVAVEIRLAPSVESSDGLTVALLRNGDALAETSLRSATDLRLPPVAVQPGDVLEVVLGPGEAPQGDTSDYRITLRRAD